MVIHRTKSDYKNNYFMQVFIAWEEENDTGYEVYVRDAGDKDFNSYDDYKNYVEDPDAFEYVASHIQTKEEAREIALEYAQNNNISFYGFV